MADCYEFRRSGRRPLTIASLGTANACFGLLAVTGGSPTAWNLWIGVVALLAWHVIANPVAGLRLNGRSLICYREFRLHRVALSDIKRVEVDEGRRPAIRLILRDGRAIHLPRASLPPLATLTTQLAAHGLDLRSTPSSLNKTALRAKPRPAS